MSVQNRFYLLPTEHASVTDADMESERAFPQSLPANAGQYLDQTTSFRILSNSQILPLIVKQCTKKTRCWTRSTYCGNEREAVCGRGGGSRCGGEWRRGGGCYEKESVNNG